MNLYNYPLKISNSGRTEKVSEKEEYIRQLIEQVLFCSPGQRINRPTFGAGLNQLVFAGNNEQLTSATQLLISASLQQWLGDLIHVESVDVTSDESTLIVTVKYRILLSQQQQQQQVVLTREVE